MRVGVCANMNAAGSDGVGLEWLEQYRRLGFDYVELPVAQLLALNHEKRREAVARVRDSGLPCRSMNNFLPAALRLLGDECNLSRLAAYLEEAMALASDLQAKVIVFGSSGARNLPDGYDPARAWDELSERLMLFSDAARTAGVTIVIEHLNRIESNVINRFSEGAALAAQVNRDNVKPLLDVYHFCVGNELPEVLDGIEIGHAHFARPLNRTLPGAAEFPQYAQLIDRARGAFDLSVEAYFDPIKGHECIQYLKQMKR